MLVLESLKYMVPVVWDKTDKINSLFGYWNELEKNIMPLSELKKWAITGHYMNMIFRSRRTKQIFLKFHIVIQSQKKNNYYLTTLIDSFDPKIHKKIIRWASFPNVELFYIKNN